MDPAKVPAIKDWTLPVTLKAGPRFLGFIDYYRRFTKPFSSIVAPIAALTEKGAIQTNGLLDP